MERHMRGVLKSAAYSLCYRWSYVRQRNNERERERDRQRQTIACNHL